MKAALYVAAALVGVAVAYINGPAVEPPAPPAAVATSGNALALHRRAGGVEAMPRRDKPGNDGPNFGTGRHADARHAPARPAAGPVAPEGPVTVAAIESVAAEPGPGATGDQRKAFLISLLLAAVVHAQQQILAEHWFDHVFGRTDEPHAATTRPLPQP